MEWWAWLIIALAAVVALGILAAIFENFKRGIKAIFWVLTLPFRAIGGIMNLIKGRK